MLAAYLLNPLKNDYTYEDVAREQLGLMMTGTEAGELGLDKSMASEKKEEQA